VTPDELSALADPARSAAFSDRDRAALAYAEAVTSANTVSDQVFGNVRKHFDDDEIVELTAVITFEICAAKFNRALEIEGQGICAVRPAAK
jgi:alkylhydroperoxidase family enzyme